MFSLNSMGMQVRLLMLTWMLLISQLTLKRLQIVERVLVGWRRLQVVWRRLLEE